jgi:hypothetical protein
MTSCLAGGGEGGGLQMITNVELINFSVGNAYCQYHKERFQFRTFSSKLNTQRAVAVVSWVTEDQLLPRRGGGGAF